MHWLKQPASCIDAVQPCSLFYHMLHTFAYCFNSLFVCTYVYCSVMDTSSGAFVYEYVWGHKYVCQCVSVLCVCVAAVKCIERDSNVTLGWFPCIMWGQAMLHTRLYRGDPPLQLVTVIHSPLAHSATFWLAAGSGSVLRLGAIHFHCAPVSREVTTWYTSLMI